MRITFLVLLVFHDDQWEFCNDFDVPYIEKVV